MGHASIKTTERYLHARRASDLVGKVTAALTIAPPSEEGCLAEQLLALDPNIRERLIERVATG